MRYHALGEVPAKRHAQTRRDGKLLVEEVMGYEGFSGNESILYHLHSPCRIADVGDFQPITGRVHQPPPVHQTFQARNFVVCSFVPRKFDYHPLAIPAPYNHSNINSDEVIYYVAGNFMSRRGVDISSFTIHPAGIPHGPHPGSVEASIGKEATEELAVMVDTFHPLKLSPFARDLDDGVYWNSWYANAERKSYRQPSSWSARPTRKPSLYPVSNACSSFLMPYWLV